MATKKAVAPKVESPPIPIEEAVARVFDFCQENKVELTVDPNNIFMSEADDYNGEELGSWDSVVEFKKNFSRAIDKSKLMQLCLEISEGEDLEVSLPKLKQIIVRLTAK